MHNLKTNFDKILDITKSFFQDSLNADGNYYFYPNKPKMSDSEVIALSILGETIGIDSENYLFGKLKSDHLKDFPNLLHNIVNKIIEEFNNEFGFMTDKFNVIPLTIDEAGKAEELNVALPGFYVFWNEGDIVKVGRHFVNSRKRALEHIRDNTKNDDLKWRLLTVAPKIVGLF